MNCYNAGEILLPEDTAAINRVPNGVVSHLDVPTRVLNCYSLKTESFNALLGSTDGATQLNVEQMKDAAASLSASFVADPDNRNSGYPILNWEKTGVYDQAEQEGLQITEAKLENGTITMRLNKVLSYFVPKSSHFAVTAHIQPTEGEVEDCTLKVTGCTSQLAEDGSTTVVTLSFAPLPQKTVAQNITATVRILDSEPRMLQLYIPVSERWEDHAAEAFAGGDGSAKNPYQIATPQQLARLAYLVNREQKTLAGLYFVQTADIDLSGTDLREDGMLWIPIGSMIGKTYHTFCGNYNGQNYTISNLTALTEQGGTGLFGATGQTGTGGEITAQLINIKLDHVTLRQTEGKSDHMVGALVGRATATDIQNCHVLSGTVTGYNDVGGLVGHFVGGESTNAYYISGCSANVNVFGRDVGGLVGQFGVGTGRGKEPLRIGNVHMYDCYFTGSVKEIDNALPQASLGGLIGSGRTNNIGRVQHCYTAATVTGLPGVDGSGANRMGGLIGDPGLTGGNTSPRDLRIENNVVLVPAMSGVTAAGYNYGRVAGLGRLEVSELAAVFSNNYVLSTMLLGSELYTGESGDNANGTTKTPEELGKQETWQLLGFDFSEKGKWQWDSTVARPVLKATTAAYEIRISEQPQNAIAFANRPAEFYVTADRGSGTLSYTWQYSADDGKTWKNFKETSDVLKVKAKLRYHQNQIRCKIVDQLGTEVYTDTATLTVRDVDFDVREAAKALYAMYQEDFVTTPKAPASLYSLNGDISDCDILIHYTDSYDISDGKGSGLPAWALIDAMVQGGSLTDYYKTSAMTTGAVAANLLQETLDLQNANSNGAFIKQNNFNYKKDGLMSNITYTMAMDMYFNGGSWGNENEAGTTGRTAAFNFLLSRLKADSATDGQFYENLSLCNGTLNKMGALRYNAEFVILMARFADDPELGTRAVAAMQDVLEMLAAQYKNGAMDASTETTARYASALVAASNVTNAKSQKESYQAQLDEIFEKLTEAWAKDGFYADTLKGTERPETGEANATAAVMMALADMANGKAMLAEFSLRQSDFEIAASDIAMLSIPNVILNDIELPVLGLKGSRFTWVSSDPSVLTADGKVTRSAQDQVVTMTLTSTYGEASVTHDFVLTVPAYRGAGGDAAYADMQNLSLLPEYIHDIELPVTGENGSTIVWTSSDEAVIGQDGKVTRPAIGQPDAQVVLKASATKDGATQVREFSVKVWANVDTTTNDGKVKEAYYLSREEYLNKKVLEGYWDVWAAYAALGDELWERDYIYDTASNSAAQPGAQVLGIVALGENPYNYNGVNYVARLQKNGYGGPYAVPVFNMLARDAAGIPMKQIDMDSARSAATAAWMGSFYMGPDIGGWACVLAAREVMSDQVYYDRAKVFCDAVSENMGVNSMGSTTLSAGCVVTGLTAFLAENVQIAGIQGMDVTKDEPWVSQDPVGMLYREFSKVEHISFLTQPIMELCDLYNVKFNGGQVGWIACGVSKARLEAQIAKANEILANKALYTVDSVKAIEDALKTVNAISEERLSAKFADYGEEYYTLYDAVRYAKTAEKAVADKAAADAVTAMIDALPAAADTTLENADAVAATRAAFDKLTEAQQSLVSADATAKLKDCEAKIADLEAAEADKAAAAKVEETINALPAADKITLENKEAIEAARAAFDALTETQQGLVSKDARDKLAAAEAAIAKLEAAEADKAAAAKVEETINALPAAADITLENKEAVAAARAAFNALTEAQQALVSKETQDKLTACEARIAELEKPEKPTDLPFTDLTQDWYMDSIRYVYEHELMYGTTDTTFAPDDALTRGMFVTMLYRMEGKPEATGNTSFTDVPANMYYAPAIAWASANGVVYGTSETAFSPEGKITREQMAAMMRRYASFKKLDTSAKADLSTFADASAVSAWAAGDMQWAVASGLLYGNNHNQLQPTANAQRAQAAAILQRFATKIVK